MPRRAATCQRSERLLTPEAADGVRRMADGTDGRNRRRWAAGINGDRAIRAQPFRGSSTVRRTLSAVSRLDPDLRPPYALHRDDREPPGLLLRHTRGERAASFRCRTPRELHARARAGLQRCAVDPRVQGWTIEPDL